MFENKVVIKNREKAWGLRVSLFSSLLFPALLLPFWTTLFWFLQEFIVNGKSLFMLYNFCKFLINSFPPPPLQPLLLRPHLFTFEINSFILPRFLRFFSPFFPSFFLKIIPLYFDFWKKKKGRMDDFSRFFPLVFLSSWSFFPWSLNDSPSSFLPLFSKWGAGKEWFLFPVNIIQIQTLFLMMNGYYFSGTSLFWVYKFFYKQRATLHMIRMRKHVDWLRF